MPNLKPLFLLLIVIVTTSLSPLPDEMRRVEKALESFGFGQGVSLSRLSGGLEHVILLARSTDGDECVLRLLKEERSEAEVLREVDATIQASESGVGPHVYYYDPVNRALFLEYLPADEEPAGQIEMIAKLKTVHERGKVSSRSTVQPFALIDSLYQAVSARPQTPMQELVDRAFHIVSSIQDILREEPPVLAHGDFHIDNVIKSGGRVYLIDWTTAGPGDRFYDLAKYTLPMDEVKREELLSLYCSGAPTAAERAHFYLTRMCVLMTIVLNRYSLIEMTHPDVLETSNFSAIDIRAWHSDELKRLGALKALHDLLEMSKRETFTHSLITLALTRAA